MQGFAIFVLVVVALAFVLVLMGVKSVEQGYESTVERFGRYTRTLTPGLNLIVPIIDRIGHKVNMMERVSEVPSQTVITMDNAQVRADAIVYFQVVDAAKAAYEVMGLVDAINNLAQTNLRNIIGSMTLDEILSKRDEINSKLLQVVDDATTSWGTKVLRVDIRELDPPVDLVEAMSRQMKADRDKRAAVLTAQGRRESEILRAEGEKQAVVLDAEGRREAAFRDAEARERLAEAEAKSTKMVSEAIAEGDIQAINYFVATKYIEQLGMIAAAENSKTVLMPLEASNMLGSIAGIAEIAKGAFNVKPGAQ